MNCCFNHRRILKIFFCECYCSSKVSFYSAVTCHCNDYFGRGCERLFIDGVVTCRRSCFLGDSLDEVKGKYERWKRVLEGKYLSVNVKKTKGL